MDRYIERVVDLTQPAENQLYKLTAEAARSILLNQPASGMREVEGSFALRPARSVVVLNRHRRGSAVLINFFEQPG